MTSNRATNAPTSPDPSFDESQFRDALGQFPTGVTVITSQSATGDPVGITVSSFNAVSLDPPLILFSVAKRCHSLRLLQDARAYAVNVLRGHQNEISDRFSKVNSEKWSGVKFCAGTTGSPILDSALAAYECEPYAEYDGGDHIIFVGRVVNIETDGEGQPLIFFRGAYGEFAALKQIPEA